MSDSDDTDLLLLIPPDFFLVQSDHDLESGSCLRRDPREVEREVVSDLITQLNDLESRICAIESSDAPRSRTEEEDLRNGSFPKSPRLGMRDSGMAESSGVLNVADLDTNLNHHASLNDLSLKEKTRYTLSGMSSPTKYVEPLSVSDDSLKWKKRLDLPEVDKLLQEMETTQAEIENKLRQREKEFGTGGLLREVEMKLGNTAGSVPDLGFGLRDLLYVSRKDRGEDMPKPPVCEEPCIRKKVTLLESKPVPRQQDVSDASWKAASTNSRGSIDGLLSKDRGSQRGSGISLDSPERRLHSMRRLKTETENCRSPQKTTLAHVLAFGERTKHPPANENDRPHPTYTCDDMAKRNGDQSQYSLRPGEKLLSLNQLWQDSGDNIPENPLRLQQKLEEEKYRRMHLEQTIQQLQKKVLEEQERVAVAVRVDSEKDRAIGRMTDGWRQMVAHWKNIEEQRHQVTQALLKEKIISKRTQDDVNKKVERWEKEVSQALDLAAGFKNKCQTLEVELSSTRGSLNGRLAELEVSLKVTEQKALQLEDERKQLASRLQISEEEHEKERKLVNDARKDLAEVEDALGRTEAELAICKEQRDLLATRLKEERGRSTTLEQQKLSLQQSLEEAMSKQARAEEDAKSAFGQLETVKSELRALYQGQLETVVKEKLIEFQGQLDSAQVAMQKELAEQKRLGHDRALQQQQALVNSHVAEMRRLESIHKEELRSTEFKLLEAEKRCARLESGKKEIAQRLHGLMEAQWQQALSIITSELSIRQAEPDSRKDYKSLNPERSSRDDEPDRFNGGPLKLRVDCDGPTNSGGGGPLTYRVSTLADTQPQKQNHLLKYIQVLLDKQPGHPVDSMTSSGLHDATQSDINLEEANGDTLKWNEMLKPHSCEKEGSVFDSRSSNSRPKPPWK